MNNEVDMLELNEEEMFEIIGGDGKVPQIIAGIVSFFQNVLNFGEKKN